MEYLPTWIVDLYGKLVGKYTNPMDPSWDFVVALQKYESNWKSSLK